MPTRAFMTCKTLKKFCSFKIKLKRPLQRMKTCQMAGMRKNRWFAETNFTFQETKLSSKMHMELSTHNGQSPFLDKNSSLSMKSSKTRVVMEKHWLLKRSSISLLSHRLSVRTIATKICWRTHRIRTGRSWKRLPNSTTNAS